MICPHIRHSLFRKFEFGSLYQCDECGLVFVKNPARVEAEPEILYKNYYKKKTGGRFNFGLEYIIRLFRLFRAFKIFSLCPKAKSILDIGSGRGFMLYFLKKYFGFTKAIGIQLSKNAVEFSRKTLGLKILDRDFLDLELGLGEFDVISMWQVLEHVANPELYIKKINQCLKGGGKLVVEVPNLDSWTARFTGQYWLGLDLKYHLYFFTPRVLRCMLEKYGFRVSTVHTFSLEYSAFISTQSVVSYLTRSDQVFFEWLQTGNMRWGVLLHVFLFFLLLPWCFVINIMLFFSKKGEVLLMVVEKP